MHFKFSSVKYRIFPYYFAFLFCSYILVCFLLEIHDKHISKLFIEKNIIALNYSKLLNNLKKLLYMYNSAIYLATV